MPNLSPALVAAFARAGQLVYPGLLETGVLSRCDSVCSVWLQPWSLGFPGRGLWAAVAPSQLEKSSPHFIAVPLHTAEVPIRLPGERVLQF